MSTYQADAVAEVGAEIAHLEARLFEHVVHPVTESVRLNLHPNLFVAFNGHARGGVSLRTARHQAAVRNVSLNLVAFHVFAAVVVVQSPLSFSQAALFRCNIPSARSNHSSTVHMFCFA